MWNETNRSKVLEQKEVPFWPVWQRCLYLRRRVLVLYNSGANGCLHRWEGQKVIRKQTPNQRHRCIYLRRRKFYSVLKNLRVLSWDWDWQEKSWKLQVEQQNLRSRAFKQNTNSKHRFYGPQRATLKHQELLDLEFRCCVPGPAMGWTGLPKSRELLNLKFMSTYRKVDTKVFEVLFELDVQAAEKHKNWWVVWGPSKTPQRVVQ